MQRKGITQPSEHVKEITNLLVDKLAVIDETEDIEIEVTKNTSRWIQKSTGDVLAEMNHSKT